MGDRTYYSVDFGADGITEGDVEQLRKLLDFDEADRWDVPATMRDGTVIPVIATWQLSVSEHPICQCDEIAEAVLGWLTERGLKREFTVDESGYNGGDLGTRCTYTPGSGFHSVYTSESGPVITQYELETLWEDAASWTEMLAGLKKHFGPESKFDFKPDETLASVLKGEA